jgi:SAM-dependent methyltransferase
VTGAVGTDPSQEFWDAAAADDPMWHIATGAAADPASFFASGRSETDAFLAHCGIRPDRAQTVLEIGCGIGRMTTRLAELYGQVIGLDISAVMLERARTVLRDAPNVRLVHGNGHDLAGIADASVDAVFSYIVLQHIPTAAGQLAYLREARRVLRPGGVAGLQVRSNTLLARALDWVGHLRHRSSGRRTLDRSWRGSRVPRAALLAAATGSGPGEGGPPATAELRPYGRRHVWVVIHRSA